MNYVAWSPSNRPMGYCKACSERHNIVMALLVMGKTEGFDEDWHGHVTALTVGPEFRRLGLAESLMLRLEQNSEK
jgi:N-terminal acetyltransferase B complex catalytic subunit